MLTIVEIERGPDGRHSMQSQSGRTECWLEGWAVLPFDLVDAFTDCGGWCELLLDEDGRVFGIEPDEDSPMERLRAIGELEAQISRDQAQLSQGDYQVIKCAEAMLLGQEAPYDPAELTARRQALRDEINAAQAEIARLRADV